MTRTNLFFKVEVEHESGERPDRMVEAIRRHILKMYGVRAVELSSVARTEE
jgi:hypothetical protein